MEKNVQINDGDRYKVRNSGTNKAVSAQICGHFETVLTNSQSLSSLQGVLQPTSPVRPRCLTGHVSPAVSCFVTLTTQQWSAGLRISIAGNSGSSCKHTQLYPLITIVAMTTPIVAVPVLVLQLRLEV
jgi:hypothetical protein